LLRGEIPWAFSFGGAMKSYGQVLYDMYQIVNIGTISWDDMSAGERSTWDELAEYLVEDGWEPMV
jgi:hypothetical protein